MTTTTELATKCPPWCEQHLQYPDGALEGTVHQRLITVGDASVMIEETTNASAGWPDPVGPTVTDNMDFVCISEGTIRNYAAALNQAADILGIPEVTA